MLYTKQQLKEDMENGTYYEGSFAYKGTDYYLFHDFGDDKYYFGTCYLTGYDPYEHKFDSFEDVMKYKPFGNIPLGELLPELEWY